MSITIEPTAADLEEAMTESETTSTASAAATSTTGIADRIAAKGRKSEDGEATTSVTKALQLLDAFRGSVGALGVSELARRSGLPKSTAFRLLATLESSGYVERVGRAYQLAWRLFELGNGVSACRPKGLRDIATPFLSELHSRTRWVTQLAVLDGGDVIYLEKIRGHEAVRIPSNVGGRVPANCSGLGKAMLAFSDSETIREVVEAGLARRTPYSIVDPGRFVNELRRIRNTGVSVDREEVALGLTCVAAPILFDGRAIAAVSVSGPSARFNHRAMAAEIQRIAAEISKKYAAGR